MCACLQKCRKCGLLIFFFQPLCFFFLNTIPIPKGIFRFLYLCPFLFLFLVESNALRRRCTSLRCEPSSKVSDCDCLQNIIFFVFLLNPISGSNFLWQIHLCQILKSIHRESLNLSFFFQLEHQTNFLRPCLVLFDKIFLQ